jgi:RND family efflux transporter MFP subunit
MRRWRKRTIAIVAVAALIIVAGAGVLIWRLTRPATATAAAATTTTAKAQKTTLRSTVSATGTLAPQNQAYLNFPAAGTVSAVNVALGAAVAAGQVLATQDTTNLESAVTSASASVDSAQSSLDTLQANSSATSAQIAAAKAQLASANAKLTSAKSDLAGATMTAPFTGVVAQVNLTVNAKVNGSTSTTTGVGTTTTVSSSASTSAQIVVVDTSTWLLNSTVGMADLATLKQGLACTVTPTGASASLPGTLTSIGIVGTTSAGTTTYPIIVTLTGNPTGLYVGGSADITIVVSEVTALTVPTAAIHQDNGQTYVIVTKDGVQTNTNVTVGRTFGAATEITKGVAEGDEIVVPAQATSSGSRTPGAGRSGFGGSGRPSGFPSGGGFPPGAPGAGAPTAAGSS